MDSKWAKRVARSTLKREMLASEINGFTARLLNYLLEIEEKGGGWKKIKKHENRKILVPTNPTKRGGIRRKRSRFYQTKRSSLYQTKKPGFCRSHLFRSHPPQRDKETQSLGQYSQVDPVEFMWYFRQTDSNRFPIWLVF